MDININSNFISGFLGVTLGALLTFWGSLKLIESNEKMEREKFRKNKAEEVLKLLETYEVTIVNAYLGSTYRKMVYSFEASIPKNKLNCSLWLAEEDRLTQKSLDNANSKLRSAHAIVKLWMPNKIDRLINKYVVLVDKLIDEGTRTDKVKVPGVKEYKQLKGGKETETALNNVTKAIIHWSNTGH